MDRIARRLGPAVGLVLALVCLLAPGLARPTAVSDVAVAADLPAWHGGIDLYRRGTFTTQQSWLWCTAADVQIIRNIARGQRDHSTASQRRYFDWMRRHNRYDLPLSAGVDPAGWTAGLRHFVDARYRLVASKSFASALKSAVTNLRRTNLPVGITVANGGHAWVLTGFTATADPLRTSKFEVTSVRVVGPLFGLQSRNGYDMPPDTRLTPAQLRHYFTPWKYAPKRMIWDGRYVSIQPIATKATSSAPAVTPKPSGKRTSPTPSLSLPSPATPSESVPASADSSPSPADASDGATADPATGSTSPAAIAPASAPTSSDGAGPGLAMVVLAVGLAAAVLVIGIGRSVSSSRTAPRVGRGR